MADQVNVFAAASLQGSLDTVAGAFEAATGTDVVITYAGSAALARQISAGAPADLFISAAPEWMDVVSTEGWVITESRVDILSNQLVLVGPVGAEPQDIDADLPILNMLGAGRLATGLTEAVPAGIYAKAALVSLGHWDSVEGRLIETENVRIALSLVATGEAPLGIVYLTDAVAEPRVAVIGVFPADSHPPITYPAAVIAPGTPSANALVAFLTSPDAKAIFAAAGFGVP